MWLIWLLNGEWIMSCVLFDLLKKCFIMSVFCVGNVLSVVWVCVR